MIQNVKNRDSLSAILFTEDENRKMDKKSSAYPVAISLKIFLIFSDTNKNLGSLFVVILSKIFSVFSDTNKKTGSLPIKKLLIYLYTLPQKKIKKQKK